MRRALSIAGILALLALAAPERAGVALPQDLPVVDPGDAKQPWAKPKAKLARPLAAKPATVRNPVTFEQIRNITGGTTEGLLLDLGDAALSGKIYSGPYPFEEGESDYDYPRYRAVTPLEQGKGLIVIAPFFRDKYNANDWPRATMTVGYRLELLRKEEAGSITNLGFYDSVVSFDRDTKAVFHRMPTVAEGPFVNLLTSDDPSRATCGP
ncbi:MAG: hypothetical protein ACYTDY_13955 [Planctomycetota bacterium]|jgi:hypothetical protein